MDLGLQQVVEYPIMCYTPPDLERKSIMICNLQRNQMQTKIKIDQTFICFIKHLTRLALDPKKKRERVQIEIQFLAYDD
jgi:hypothetical protein